MPYHKRFHSDALAGFMSLTLEQRGAYQTLLDLIYDRGGPIPDNERLLAGYMGCSGRKWRAIRDELLQTGKIQLTEDGRLTNVRAEKEIENALKTRRVLAESGSKGGRKRSDPAKLDNKNNGKPQASLELGLSEAQAILDTRSQNTLAKANGGAAPPDPIKVMFDAGVQLLTEHGQNARAARSLVAKWRNERGEAWVIEAITAARRGAYSDPAAWIEGRVKSTARERAPPDTRGSAREAAKRYAFDDEQRRKIKLVSLAGGIND